MKLEPSQPATIDYQGVLYKAFMYGEWASSRGPKRNCSGIRCLFHRSIALADAKLGPPDQDARPGAQYDDSDARCSDHPQRLFDKIVSLVEPHRQFPPNTANRSLPMASGLGHPFSACSSWEHCQNLARVLGACR
jgi:hypothetical protein